MGQEIADEVLDLAAIVRLSSQIDARGVEVDGRHVFGDSQQLSGEDALAAADVEHMASRAGAECSEDHRVVVDVVVPARVDRHRLRCSHASLRSGLVALERQGPQLVPKSPQGGIHLSQVDDDPAALARAGAVRVPGLRPRCSMPVGAVRRAPGTGSWVAVSITRSACCPVTLSYMDTP